MVKKYKVSKNVSKEPALVIYDQLMLTPGIWNGVKFTRDEIQRGIENTDWTNPENFALIDSHPKMLNNGRTEIPLSTSWQGYFDKISYKTLEEGVNKEGMYGDLYIYDPVLASKLLSNKSPLAVSIDAKYASSSYGASQLNFTNTALVYRPGCKDAYIQLEDNGDNHAMRIICEDDVGVEETVLEGEIKDENTRGDEAEIYGNQKIKLEYELYADQLIQVYDSNHSLVFEGSVLSFNKDDSGNKSISVINDMDTIEEFMMQDHSFLPIIKPAEVVETECVGEEQLKKCDKKKQLEDEDKEIVEVKVEETQQEDINIVERGFNYVENKMDINSLNARISLIEEKLGIKLEDAEEESSEEVSEEKPEEAKEEEVVEQKEVQEEESEPEAPKEDEKSEVVEEVKEEAEESKEESNEEAPAEEIKEEVSEELSEEAPVKEVSEEKIEEIQESEEVTTLKSKVAELEAKLAEKEVAKEEVKLESKEEKVAESKTSVQLEGAVAESKPKFANKFEEAHARLNNKI